MLFNSINQDIINTYKYLIPVPLHYARLRERGFNQSLLIAEEISKNTKIPINLIINRNKNNQTQTKLSKVERKINISDIFKVNRNDKINFDKISLTNELDRVLIIDDVLTTGATVNSIAKELSNLGFKNIDVATLLKA
jgi:competence protein ComFC